jgi:hypothetical protein
LRKKLQERQDTLKESYKKIEGREKRRLKSRQIKLEKEAADLREFVKDFDYFMQDFDLEMDFLANRANFDYYWQEFKQLEQTMSKPTNFFAVSEFKFPTFLHMQAEIDSLNALGQVQDNSDFSAPLVVFNTYNLSSCYVYLEKMRQFERT